MANIPDDLYLGNFAPSGLTLGTTASENPTLNQGVGPMGRVAYYNIVPLTLQTNNLATNQTMTAGAALAMTAGTGVTTGVSPDGLGRTVYQFDVPRSVSLTSVTDLHLINFTIIGYGTYGGLMTQTMAGPTGNTVNSKKAFKSIFSITPGTTDGAHNIAAGSSDIFGLPYLLGAVGYVTSVKWDEVLAQDAGTAVIGDSATATATTGDTRGTYLPSSASNGVRRLVLAQHLPATACGSAATRSGAIGVPQA